MKKEVENYCKWAEIKDIGFFLGKACQLVFDEDKEWQAHCRSIKPGKKHKKYAHKKTKGKGDEG